MLEYKEILIFLAGFIVIAIASNQIAKVLTKTHLPLITGLLLTGIVAGPFALKLIPDTAPEKLFFVNEFALAFIAFAAAAELYLKELRSRFRSITWMTVGQLAVTFLCSSAAIYYLADRIPFMQGMATDIKISVAILAGTIFVARSPASAIAVINEMRAKGPFTQTALGVTVVIDFLVIMLFAISFSIAQALVHNVSFDQNFILLLFFELLIAFLAGYLLGKLLALVLAIRIGSIAKTALIMFLGYGVYWASGYVREWSFDALGMEVYIEPLITCIIGSFYVANYTKHRPEFLKILNDAGPIIYVIFFTLTGASLSLDILIRVWAVALFLFGVRLFSLIVGSLAGGALGGESWKFIRISWMPYVTQAGVSLGLATVVASSFTGWGQEFATIIIAVIVLNQLIGPALFKWSITLIGESHIKANTPEFDGNRNAVIFGLEGQSFALARQLKDHGWDVVIASRKGIIEEEELDVIIKPISSLNLEEMKRIGADSAEAIIVMLSDKENYEICEVAYEHFGTKDLVVRLNDRANFDRFHALGALIVEPSTAIVSLMDHLVRSPQAASLLLGMDESQDTVDLEILNPNIHGISLRDLRLPSDILILAISRGGQSVITHGYTRLRLNDIVTVVGSIESIENVALRLRE
ncbi:MAG: potassium transporter TrkA [Bacteroidetes bacterium]|nr:MAG: potassium transporter TrkA [Bacteroidota bacterium]